jgi:hypothetical protein
MLPNTTRLPLVVLLPIIILPLIEVLLLPISKTLATPPIVMFALPPNDGIVTLLVPLNIELELVLTPVK